jgi:diazepam-binding inhibitor (GABA receptor modulating acyl-CoA-binding protein)
MEAKFLKAAEIIKTQKDLKLSDAELLVLYSHFKQATVGDCNTPQPGMFSFTEKAKWNAWNELKGMTKEKAQENYVNVVAKYVPSGSLD